jgi:N-acetylmuramoyl-L-alanine amidase
MTKILPVLRKGSKSEAVRAAQEQLVAHGFGDLLGPDGADGNFGKNTFDAVIAFQRARNLKKVDGIIGPETWQALQKERSAAITLPDDMRERAAAAAAPLLPPHPPSPRQENARPLVVLDPGHGPRLGTNGQLLNDPGAIVKGANGSQISEARINLSVAKKLATMLEQQGFSVQLTRDENTVLPDRFDSRLAAGGTDKVLHISLHADKNDSNPSFSGLHTYFSKHANGSKQFAYALKHKAEPRPHSTDLLDMTKLGCEAALVEMGNMSNPRDLARLTSEQGQQEIAKHLAARITGYYTGMTMANAALPKLAAATQVAAAETSVANVAFIQGGKPRNHASQLQ